MSSAYGDYGFATNSYDYGYGEDDEDYYTSDEDAEVPVHYAINYEENLTQAETLKAAGNTSIKENRVDDAIAQYSAALQLVESAITNGLPSDEAAVLHATLLSNRAAAYIKAQNYADALVDAVECLKLSPTNGKARYREATCHCRLGDTVAARSSLLRLTAKDQADKSVSALVSEVEALEEEIQTARNLITSSEDWTAADTAVSALESRFTGKWVSILRARVLLGQNKIARALKLLSALHLQAGHDPELALWRGVALYLNGQSELATRLLQDVLRGDPDNNEARKYLKLIRALDAKKEEANGLFKSGRSQEALDAYTEALNIDPSNATYAATILSNRAAAHMQLSDYHSAARDCTESLKLVADAAKVLARRGRCWAAMGQHNDALRDFNRAMELDPSIDLEEEIKKAKVGEKRSKQTSLYTTLGVPVHASEDAIKKAYRKLAMQWHPDKHQAQSAKNAEEMFKKITEAYEILGDKDKRRKYDMGMDVEDIHRGDDHGHGGHGGHPGFSSFFGGGFGGGGFGGGGFSRSRRAHNGFGF